MKPIIFGVSGTQLTEEEKSFLKSCNPLGFTLFKRNIETPEQVKALIREIRAALGRPDAPFFIDQEGGRAVRFKPPHWPVLPSMEMIGKIANADRETGREAMRLHARLTAHLLGELDILGTFGPVLDLRVKGATDCIGDRSLGSDPALIADLGRVAVETYLENGILPCIKHLPGHGRMALDPHKELPVIETSAEILRETDFKPFQALRDCPLGMTSHGIFTAFDSEYPTSISPVIHQKIIREEIGFEGILLTDDLAMKALSADTAMNAKRALEAGSDIALYCWGKMPEMVAIDRLIGPISPSLLRRWEKALALVKRPASPYSPEKDRRRLETLVASVSAEYESMVQDGRDPFRSA